MKMEEDCAKKRYYKNRDPAMPVKVLQGPQYRVNLSYSFL